LPGTGWREITRITEGGELGGRYFLLDRSLGGWDSVVERFRRMFDLAETKRCTVAEMFSLGWGVDGEA
jgi:hypothetical protein